jgi:hypothetical protein
MLSALQNIHDSSLSWSGIILGSDRFQAVGSVKTIAEEHGLDESVLNGFIEQRRKAVTE